MQQTSIIGKMGEQVACQWLEANSHQIICRNFRSSHKEIDIVSLTGYELHIIEVKSKQAPISADPVLSIDKKKQKNLVSAAKAFLNSKYINVLPKDLEVVFDVITVVFDNEKTDIRFYPKAYIPTYV